MKTSFDHTGAEFSPSEKRDGNIQNNTEMIIEAITWVVLAMIIFFL